MTLRATPTYLVATSITAQNKDHGRWSQSLASKHTTSNGEARHDLQDHQRDIITIRDGLVLANLGLVRAIASLFANHGECIDDLRQVGYIGLLKAADRYDSERGVAFSSYGYAKILGEIRRHFRDRCWSVRVPRGVQESYRKGERPYPYGVLSLDAVSEAGQPALIDVLGSVDVDFERADLHADLVGACGGLTQRERSVLRLRFFEEKSQKAIGLLLGRSQMYVCRVESSALKKLRESSNGVAA